MTLADWERNGCLTAHIPSPGEIADLLGVVARDLADCQTPGLSPDWRLNIAYNAALQAATAALAASGYRATRDAHHYRVIQSLALTLGAGSDLVDHLEAFRKKRNVGGYERAGAVSDQEAEEMTALARQVGDRVTQWLDQNHPHLMASGGSADRPRRNQGRRKRGKR